MANAPPEHCPACGAALDAVEPGVYRCPACEDYVFHNPVPNARVVVLDADGVLLVEIPDASRVADPPYPDHAEWELPGGHVGPDEQPAAAAARELEEETALAADPDDLVLFDAGTRQVVPASAALVLYYAVRRSATDGDLAAASDAGDAQFWTPAALTASEDSYRDLHAEPGRFAAVDAVAAAARDALDRAP